MIVTLVLILGPSFTCLYLIYTNTGLVLISKGILTLIYALTLSLCLHALFKASTTDPGIIPKIEPLVGDLIPNKHFPYFVEYLNKDELD